MEAGISLRSTCGDTPPHDLALAIPKDGSSVCVCVCVCVVWGCVPTLAALCVTRNPRQLVGGSGVCGVMRRQESSRAIFCARVIPRPDRRVYMDVLRWLWCFPKIPGKNFHFFDSARAF